MLDDLAVVIQSEDVDASPIAVAWPLLVAMQYDVIPFGNHALEVDAFAGIFLRHPRKVCDKRVLAIRYRWVMLNVDISDVARDRFSGLALVEHQVVELHHVLLILLQTVCHQNTSKLS